MTAVGSGGRPTAADGCSGIIWLSVEVSYDDGTTWTAVDVRRTGNPARWRAGLRNPGGGFASLRAKSVDADGNTAEYTVIRAYRLR